MIPSQFSPMTRRRLGIEVPVNGQQPATVTVPIPRYSPTTAFRFEIQDVEGNPIPGAAVSIYLDDVHLVTPPLADMGGNVSVSVADIQNAEYARRKKQVPAGTLQGRLGQAGKRLYAVIQAPGYMEEKIEIADLSVEKGWDAIQQRHVVTLEKESEFPIVPVLGIVAGIAAVLWLTR